MSSTIEDFVYDEAYASEIYEEHLREIKNESIEEFQKERLQEYYLDNNTIPELIIKHLEGSKKLIDAGFIEAGLVFSFSAIEIILKEIFLKPLLHGSFITYSIADLVVEETLRTSNTVLKKTLFYILKEIANLDFNRLRRPSQKKTLWNEISEVQKIRNSIIHGGKETTRGLASRAYRIAQYLNNDIFPKVLKSANLRIEADKICIA